MFRIFGTCLDPSSVYKHVSVIDLLLLVFGSKRQRATITVFVSKRKLVLGALYIMQGVKGSKVKTGSFCIVME